MITLNGTNERLEVKTGSTGSVDVAVSWNDRGTGATPNGGDVYNVANSATQIVIPAPAAGVARSMRSMTIYNTHATNAQQVTVQQVKGAVTAVIASASVPAGGAFNYTGGGFELHQGGMPTVNQMLSSATAAVNALNLVVLPADVTNNNALANTIADITGLSFAVTAGQMYYFRSNIRYTAAAATTGARFSASGPGSPTFMHYRSDYPLTATSRTFNEGLTAYDTPAASNASSLTAGNIAIVEGFIQPSANGTVIMRFASEIANSAIVAKAGSILEWVRVI